MKKYIPYVLILAGIVIIAIALFQKITTDYYHDKIMEEYNAYIDDLNNSETVSSEDVDNVMYDKDEKIEKPVEQQEVDEKKSEILDQDTNKENVVNKAINVFDNQEISGIIDIPKINVSSAILEGTDDKALKYAVGHYPETAQPGEKGNCVLLGHRNYVYGHFFRRLNELEVGDEVIIKKDTNTFTYVVTESFVVSPEEVWVLDETENAEITMITCTPLGIYTDRLIVKGLLLSDGTED